MIRIAPLLFPVKSPDVHHLHIVISV